MELGRPNFTAWFVLQGTLLAERQFKQNAEENEVSILNKTLAKAAGRSWFASRASGFLPPAWQYRLGEWVTNTGRLRHFYFRKRAIKNLACELIGRQRPEQLVILGAGLDAMGLGLAHAFPDIRVIEVDTAPSQQFKVAVLDKNCVVVPDNLEFVSGDLRQPLPDLMSVSSLFRPGSKTLWMAEGVLMFIPEADVRRIFTQIKELSNRSSYCIFTSLPYRDQGTAVARMIQRLYLHRESSPFQWVLSVEGVASFMQALGYTVIETTSYRALHHDFCNDEALKKQRVGENIHVVSMVD